MRLLEIRILDIQTQDQLDEVNALLAAFNLPNAGYGDYIKLVEVHSDETSLLSELMFGLSELKLVKGSIEELETFRLKSVAPKSTIDSPSKSD